MNRGLAIALFASLAINIFLGGFVVGRLAGGPPHSGFGHPRHEAGLMMFPDLDVLSPAGRETFREVFAARHEALRERHRELSRRRAAFTAALAADPWNRAKAEAALAELKAATDEQETAFAALIIDAFERLSTEDRKALVEAGAAHWRGRSGKMHKHRRWPKDFSPPPDDEPPVPPGGE
jgi:Spy/CpxP family protein refolding chaperone